MGLASSIGGFFVEVGAKVDTSSFDKGEKKVKDLGASLKTLIGGITATTTALVGMATVAGNVETKNLKLADSIGISSGKLDQWKMAASVAGTSADGLVASMDALNTKMQGLKMGQVDMNLAKNLGFMGIGYSQFANMEADQRMISVIKAAEAMDDQAKAAVLVGNVLGSAGEDYYHYLQVSGKSIEDQLAKSKRLIFTDENSKRQAMAFNYEIKGLFETVKSLGTYISSKIAGQLTPIVAKIKETLAANRDLIKSGISTFISSVGSALNSMINVIGRVTPMIGGLINKFGGLDKIIVRVGLGIAGIKLVKFAGGIMSVVKGVSMLKMALAGIGFGALILVMEDIATYFSGGRSLLGVIIANIDLIKDKLKFDFGFDADDVVAGFKDLGSAIGNLITKLTGASSIEEGLRKIANGLGKLAVTEILTAIERLKILANIMTDLLEGDWDSLGVDIKNFFKNMGEGIVKAVEIVTGTSTRDSSGSLVVGTGISGAVAQSISHPLDALTLKLGRVQSSLADAVNASAGRNVWTGSVLTGRSAASDSGWKNARIGFEFLSDDLKNKIMEMIEDGYSASNFTQWIKPGTIPRLNEWKASQAIHDGIISPTGKVTQVDPNDWVIAAKDLNNVASAFLPKGMHNSYHTNTNAPVIINQNFTFNGGGRDIASAVKQQAYNGANSALLQNLKNSQRILQQMPGTR